MATKTKKKAEPKDEGAPFSVSQVIEVRRPPVRPLAELLEDGDLVARYLEQHGVWEDHHTRTHLGLGVERKLRYCECPICADARAALNLTD